MMKKLALTLVFGILGVGVYGQTIKTLGYNSTNGQIVANTGTNVLTFTNISVAFSAGDISIQSPNILWGGVASINLEEKYLSFDGQEKLRWREEDVQISVPLTFSGTNTASATRTNLGLGATWLTNTNAANFRTAIGLGTTDNVTFGTILSGAANASFSQSPNGGVALGWQGTATRVTIDSSFSLNTAGLAFSFGTNNSTGAAITRTNLGLGNGITTNRTFVAYDGTNYTTNSVTISNGIITGWTQ